MLNPYKQIIQATEEIQDAIWEMQTLIEWGDHGDSRRDSIEAYFGWLEEHVREIYQAVAKVNLGRYREI